MTFDVRLINLAGVSNQKFRHQIAKPSAADALKGTLREWAADDNVGSLGKFASVAKEELDRRLRDASTASCLFYLGRWQEAAGQYGEAARSCEEAVTISLRLELYVEAANCLTNRGFASAKTRPRCPSVPPSRSRDDTRSRRRVLEM